MGGGYRFRGVVRGNLTVTGDLQVDGASVITGGQTFGGDVHLGNDGADAAYIVGSMRAADSGAAVDRARVQLGAGQTFEVTNASDVAQATFTVAGALTLVGNLNLGTIVTFDGASGTVTKAGGDLTLSTTTSGDIILTPAGTGVNLSAGVLQVGGTTVIDASRNFQPDLTVTFQGATGTVTKAGGNLTLSTTTSGDIVLTPAGTGVNVSAGVLQVGGTTVITAARNFQPDLTVTFQGATGTVTKAGGNLTLSTTTSGDIVLTPAGTGVNVSAGVLQVGGTTVITAARNFQPDLTVTFQGATGTVTKAGGNLTISTTTSGDIILTPAADVNISSGGLEIAGTAAIDSSRNFAPATTITFGGASGTVTKAGGNLTISTTTSGDILLVSAGDIRAIGENLVLASPAAVDKILTWASGNSRFDFNDLLNVGGSSGITFSAAASLVTSAGDLTLAPAGEVIASGTGGTTNLIIRVSAGAPTDAASSGAIVVDSTNGRLYFRYGDPLAWHYVNQTA